MNFYVGFKCKNKFIMLLNAIACYVNKQFLKIGYTSKLDGYKKHK